jgi:hypothetical protein
MGSYASQLSRMQRWMVLQYVKSKQLKLSEAADSTKTGGSVSKDSVSAKK